MSQAQTIIDDFICYAPTFLEDSPHFLKISRALNAILTLGMKIDEAFIRLGVSLPVGGSLFCVAQRP